MDWVCFVGGAIGGWGSMCVCVCVARLCLGSCRFGERRGGTAVAGGVGQAAEGGSE